MKLICIDFDFTIVDGHTHNSILNSGQENDEEQWNVVKNFPAIGSAEKWKKIFKYSLDNGCKVAIVSFNNYEHIITKYLERVIGLSKSQMNQIHIVSGFPEQGQFNKNEHISKAKTHFQLTDVPNEEIVLIDDDPSNIEAAQKNNYTCITATKDGKHLENLLLLEELNKLIDKLKKEINSCWPYFHKDRKKTKLAFLQALYLENRSSKEKNLRSNLNDVNDNFSGRKEAVYAGLFSTRTKDFLKKISKIESSTVTKPLL